MKKSVNTFLQGGPKLRKRTSVGLQMKTMTHPSLERQALHNAFGAQTGSVGTTWDEEENTTHVQKKGVCILGVTAR